MNDGYIAQDDRRRRRREGGSGDAYAVCYEIVSEIYLHCEMGEVQGNSDTIKLCTWELLFYATIATTLQSSQCTILQSIFGLFWVQPCEHSHTLTLLGFSGWVENARAGVSPLPHLFRPKSLDITCWMMLHAAHPNPLLAWTVIV